MKLLETLNIYKFSVKYWLEGDSLADAKGMATFIVRGFRKNWPEKGDE